ncbi:MAG: type I methionyl aminopeptidase [Bacilli bacterium]|nr:type I methionyl aminopeptidase [Bacilli bacterium]
MITIKSDREIELMKIAGSIVYETHQYLKPYVKPGIKTIDLDRMAEDFIKSKGATPSCKGYEGFPYTLCISVNDEVVHGFPSEYKLKEGDIVSIDICACYKGYHGDSAWTYAVGKISDDDKYLMKHTEKALYEGIKQAVVGNRVGDISNSVEVYAREHNLGVVKELVGHGVGTNLHEDPNVPNYGEKGKGPLLKAGMVIAIEPMLTFGDESIYVDDNEWTIKTDDESNAAHFEHTVLITENGPVCLTGDEKNG